MYGHEKTTSDVDFFVYPLTVPIMYTSKIDTLESRQVKSLYISTYVGNYAAIIIIISPLANILISNVPRTIPRNF